MPPLLWSPKPLGVVHWGVQAFRRRCTAVKERLRARLFAGCLALRASDIAQDRADTPSLTASIDRDTSFCLSHCVMCLPGSKQGLTQQQSCCRRSSSLPCIPTASTVRYKPCPVELKEREARATTNAGAAAAAACSQEESAGPCVPVDAPGTSCSPAGQTVPELGTCGVFTAS